jgi:4-oxalmesaconate hydratase
MIIDCHGHYTVLPKAHDAWREAQKAAFKAGEAAPPYPAISDDEIRETIESNQLRLIKAVPWARACNDLIARVVGLYPEVFAGVCMLPQSPEAGMASAIAELRRCVDMGFIGCNLNPDPGGGHFKHPPLTDEFWFPFYEAMCELDVPAMIHVSGSCNPALHATGAYYIAADTIAFMQLLEGDLFARFPDLRLIIPHGGGAVPYHWGRYRGLADMLKKPDLSGHLMNNVFFDTCVYHQPGIDLLAEVIETRNILFGSEMVGAVRGIDPTTGHYFDDTKRYVDALDIAPEQRHAIFEGNARRVFPRLDAQLKERGQ